jgi:hypothetical protein
MREIMWASVAQNLVWWLGLLVAVAGVVFTAAYLKRSRWARLLFAGFLVRAIVDLATKVALPVLVTSSSSDFPRVPLFFLATSILGVMAYAALVLGVGGLLSELSRHRVSPGQSSSAE